ncbi:MAG TPA: DUF411 domain-containing protein [Methylococcus sp.]|nr:DUF411 domain-containing protein [Methylococcus sp.]
MRFVNILAVFLAAVALPAAAQKPGNTPSLPAAAPAGEPMTVYRSPTCGCCKKWVEHIKAHGFVVRDIVRDDMDAVKRELGVPGELQSCHTAVIGGYRIEGHVPAAEIREVLQAKPPFLGLSVPGMPVGTPGMEMGGRKDAFTVVGFGPGSEVRVVREYPAE